MPKAATGLEPVKGYAAAAACPFVPGIARELDVEAAAMTDA